MSHKKTILLVEDNELDKRLLEAVLKRKGFNVIALTDGSRCLEVVNDRKPDLVLLDIMMPNLHGNKLLQLLREKHTSVDLPILMTTAKSSSSDIIESLANGANDYLIKPIDFDVAVMRIQTQLTITDQSKELAKLRTLETIAALITTYNHEINNPLAIAIASLKNLEDAQEKSAYKRLDSALWRIADIIKLMRESIESTGIQLEDYGGSSKIIRLAK